MITTVTGKNQITLPAQLVKALDIQPGTRINWSITADGTIQARLVPSRGELARKIGGIGRTWIQPGDDPIADLLAEHCSRWLGKRLNNLPVLLSLTQ